MQTTLQKVIAPLLLLCFSTFGLAYSQSSERSVSATQLKSGTVQLDGRLEEDIWKRVEFASRFVQREPNEGVDATERTEVAFVYDDEALYIGARMYSQAPSKMQQQLGRRDNQGNAERITISLDTYYDRRTARSFSVSVSGVRADYFQPQDEMNFRTRDYSYNPVWTASTNIDSLGWTAEIRIPFSQLRFKNLEKQTWGININRYLPHKNEDAFWVMIPQDETGWASRFGRLIGIKDISQSNRLEFLPYVAGESQILGNPSDQNPFEEKTSFSGRVGGDVKVGLGPNFTLDGTINPDFGQVEADPAQVNLSAFETFFEEKRPFFTEGQQLFNVLGGGGGRPENYFYSRRIGSAPSLNPSVDFAEEISNTSILGAAKVTGRTPGGLSIGGLTAITNKETADTFDSSLNQNGSVKVEPLTSYNVLRLEQEFGESSSTAGIILTGVYRNLESGSNLDKLLNKTAITGGGDWNLRFLEGRYEFTGDAGFSYVQGSSESILKDQQSSARYFQRPDASYLSIDSTQTSMTGMRGSLEFSKNSGKHWLWELSASTKTPGFELNDTGILFRSDDISSRLELTYRENNPGSWYQSYRFELSGDLSWNYGGVRRETKLEFGPRLEFKNFWTFFSDVSFSPRTLDDRLTRGGPLMGSPRKYGLQGGLFTNRSSNIFGRVFINYEQDEFGGWNFSVNPSIEVRTGGRWEFQLRPRISRRTITRQYIETRSGGPVDTFGQRYIFANIDRSTLSLQTRINYAFSPDFTLELYAEPFVATGNYYRPGQLPEPGSYDLNRFEVLDNDQGESFTVRDGADVFDVPDPDFLTQSFRSSLVLRYQWRPGSTFFLVWQQNRSMSSDQNRFVEPGDLVDALGQTGDNIFAIKFTYWLPAN
ncbi:MAG: DUF5916 domain-containing protein [Balneolaceae bacterium]|nr:DUF5916 domain-containing protein [Balneolaceae bacterium]